MIRLGWNVVEELCFEVAERWQGKGISKVWGVPAGGLHPAAIVAGSLGVPLLTWRGQEPRQLASERILVVDDLVDSGRTLRPFKEAGCLIDALLRKAHSPEDLCPSARLAEDWVVFPWERGTAEGGPEDAVVRLLEWMGEDPTREGLLETPRRVVKALREMTEGLRQDPTGYLKTFEEPTEDPVIVRGIRFTSLCEHHLLPFSGTAVVAYLPKGRVLGLSKLPRVFETFARRPQMQERLTRQVAELIREATRTDEWSGGAACAVKAHHSCMGCRGVRQMDAEMVTCHAAGSFPADLLSELRRML